MPICGKKVKKKEIFLNSDPVNVKLGMGTLVVLSLFLQNIVSRQLNGVWASQPSSLFLAKIWTEKRLFYCLYFYFLNRKQCFILCFKQHFSPLMCKHEHKCWRLDFNDMHILWSNECNRTCRQKNSKKNWILWVNVHILAYWEEFIYLFFLFFS